MSDVNYTWIKKKDIGNLIFFLSIKTISINVMNCICLPSYIKGWDFFHCNLLSRLHVMCISVWLILIIFPQPSLGIQWEQFLQKLINFSLNKPMPSCGKPCRVCHLTQKHQIKQKLINRTYQQFWKEKIKQNFWIMCFFMLFQLLLWHQNKEH